MRRIDLVTMLNAATSTGASLAHTNNNCDLLSVQVSGTATSIKVQVQGKVDETADWTNIVTMDTATFELSDGDTGITAAGIYVADISGLVMVRVNLATVSGGNVTVTGSFENTSEN